MDRRSLARGGGIISMCGFLSLSVAACAGSVSSSQESTREPGIVLGSGAGMSTPSAPPGDTSADPGTSAPSLVDPRADLDIDDQRGDGTRIVVESLSTSLQGVTLVVLDEKGRVVAKVPVTPGVQPVSIALDSPLSRSQELQGMLMAGDGNGILVDGDGDAIEEDFDYLIR